MNGRSLKPILVYVVFVFWLLLLAVAVLGQGEPTVSELIAPTEEIRWQGRMIIEFEGELYALSDCEIGLREDGVVVWREIE